MSDTRNVYKFVVGKLVKKWLPGRLRRMWEDNIKMDIRQIYYEGGKWMELAEDRVQ
jgi:hypothetical protein